MIFISYSHQDTEFEQQLEDELDERKIVHWSDRRIIPGADWKISIDTAIAECSAMVVILTPYALVSPYTTYEWSYAYGKGKTVIPIMLVKPDPTNSEHHLIIKDGQATVPDIHPKLLEKQWIDFTQEHQWEMLFSILEGTDPRMTPPVQKAFEALNSPDPTERHQAFIALVEDIDDPSAELALIKAMNNDNRKVRQQAVLKYAVKVNFDPKAIPYLINLLKTIPYLELNKIAAAFLKIEGTIPIDTLIEELRANINEITVFERILSVLEIMEKPYCLNKLQNLDDELSELPAHQKTELHRTIANLELKVFRNK